MSHRKRSIKRGEKAAKRPDKCEIKTGSVRGKYLYPR